MRSPLDGLFLGRRNYAEAHAFMMELYEARREGLIQDTVLLLEHSPVITLGRGAKHEHLLRSRDELEALGVELMETGRGGDVTLHAPGQLIAYPIVDLSPDRRDVRKYVQGLTRVMNALAAQYDLNGGTIKELIGLWIDLNDPQRWPGETHAINPVKLGAIGVRISRWVTTHGFALNLSTDLSLFDLIVPCGIRGRGVTSIEQLTGVTPDLSLVARKSLELLNNEWGAGSPRWYDLRDKKLAHPRLTASLE